MHARLLSVSYVAGVILLSACSSATTGPGKHPSLVSYGVIAAAQGAAASAKLVTMNSQTGAFEFWPIQPGGSSHPTPLSDRLGLGLAGALATRGDEIVAAVENPPGVALYDVRSEKLRIFADPFGTPIDVAVGPDRSVFAMNVARSGAPVTMYRPPHASPVELRCAAVTFGEAIAVDDEGDLFIDGYGPNLAGVAEIPNGVHGLDAARCFVLPLKGDVGYVGGVAIDPRTDDLLTLDDPDLCAGGREGRLTIYPKPYDRRTGRSHIIGINCSGGLRLNADSTLVFIGDSSVDGSTRFFLQRSYPDGTSLGAFEGGSPGGFTTLPSELPN